MKLFSRLLPAALLVTAALLTTAVAQAPQGTASSQAGPQAGQGGEGRGPRNYPAPTNLKVLPKNLTGQQVRDIMEGWQGDTGLKCQDCHKPDPTKIGQNGRPQLDYASDEKPTKEIARIMYTMTEAMKQDYIPKAAALDEERDNASELTCGTCHRGKNDPEQYIPPKRNQQGGQGGPEGQAGAPPVEGK